MADGTRPEERAEARRLARFGALAVGFVFLARAVVFLYRAHPQDDAYILFGYVRRFVAGEGIVFHAGGPPAEGATDFLWFALLSVLHRAGLDIAVAAALANAAGGALLGGLIARAIARSLTPGPARSMLLLLLAPAAFAGGAVAAAVGFGSLLYSAAVAWTFVAAIAALEGDERATLRLPFAGLLLGLIRPDGVVLGAGFALIGACAAARRRLVGPFAARASAALAIGAAYFAWRWSYFGLPLPLPLYVKGHSADELAGASAIAGWFSHPSGAWPLGAGLVAVLVLGGRAARTATLALAATPLLAHLAALAFARQSQNIAFRFEAPEQAVLLVLLVLASAAAIEMARAPAVRTLVVLVAVAAVVPGVLLGIRQLRYYEGTRTYVDVFGPRLGAILAPEDRVALGDQAGRIPYWSRARMFDLVGLNTRRTALAPPDAAYLAEIDPDLFLLYTGPSTFDLEKALASAKEDVVPLALPELAGSVRPDQRDLYEHGIARYEGSAVPDSACNVIAAKYLVDSSAYDLYAVRYTGSFKHLYAIRRGHPRAAAILAALRESLAPESYRSYARIVGLPFARD
ncbi:MAG TPA: hypothetical protein VGR31_15105 [Planctomycetota bacterium]|jgi:hypothetical protein|nr:hypothetical protein [Planctomycetota bacterium]